MTGSKTPISTGSKRAPVACSGQQVAFADRAVNDANISDDTFVGIRMRIENQCPQAFIACGDGRRNIADDSLQDVAYATSRLG